MNLITRLSATLSGKLEEVVSHVENHDAVVAVALKDTRAAVAKARVRLEQVRRDGQNLRERVTQLDDKEQLWEKRARDSAAIDETKALECVARRNQCRQQKMSSQQALARHTELEQKMAASVAQMEERLRELMNQQNLMRSRQSTAEAARIINRIEASSPSGLEATFDRWEMLITETEYANGALPDIDMLDASFTRDEQTNVLKAELDALLEAKE